MKKTAVKINGKIVGLDKVPTIRLKFRGVKTKFLFEIDTGFSGELLMSLEYFDVLNALPSGSEKFRLADDFKIETVTGILDIAWFGQFRETRVSFAQTSSFLLGRKLLENTTLELNFKERSVEIRR